MFNFALKIGRLKSKLRTWNKLFFRDLSTKRANLELKLQKLKLKVQNDQDDSYLANEHLLSQ